jgi:multiple sugar transport system ATP-binding protein
MDEPLSNLDAKLRGHRRAELKHMQHQLGITTIYVTHDQIEAMTLGHRVAVLHQGRLQQIGSPHRIYDDPANIFVAGFVGSPPMNFVPGELRDGRFKAMGGTLPVSSQGADRHRIWPSSHFAVVDWARSRISNGPVNSTAIRPYVEAEGQ